MKLTFKTFLFFLSTLMVLSLAFAPTAQAIPVAVTGLQTSAYILPSVQSAATANSSSSQLARVSAGNLFDLPVVQQPSGNSGYVSTMSDTFTQFGMASNYGSIGVLAHNYLAGKYLNSLSVGDVITVTFTDGSIKDYTVSDVKIYQALSPESMYSNFVDVNNTSKVLSSSNMFLSTFGLKGALVLQTCVTKNGNSSWGRIFVIAYAS
jgi:hypothetical protein